MRTSLVPLWGLLLLAAGCDAPTYVATPQAAHPALRVSPLGPSTVSLTVTNGGTATWKPGKVRMALREEPSWSGGTLELVAPAEPGAQATFRGPLSGPAHPGLYTLGWHLQRKGTSQGSPIELPVEVTCSDGVFCNGEERFAGGQCVSGPSPCDDGAACTMDTCDEQARTCQHEATGTCAVCQANCVPDCAGKQCGDDGCGGQCGTCPEGTACAQSIARCMPETQSGTCANPLPLLPAGTPLLGDHVLQGDSSGGLHQAVPTCNRTSRSVESVYTFTLTERMGLEARSTGYDTVLHLRRKSSDNGTTDCLDNTPAHTVACSDDSSPPGDFGSRIAVALDPGTYYLIVDGFDASQSGPFALQVRFTREGCVPKCDGLYCGGSDGCGGDCGTCEGDATCVQGRCQPTSCTPQCDGRQCGDDGCGGQCGTCPQGRLCVPATGACETFPDCDHLRPTCNPPCGDSEFCGTDCACHPVSAPLPDLVVDANRLRDEILFDSIDVTEFSCSRVEECVGGTGRRRLLRFSVEALNQGNATLTVPPPAERPDLFAFSPCHGHFHFGGFASYVLLDGQGRTVLTGRKQAYCMEDTQRITTGPGVSCSKRFNCEVQGIQRGWSDLYGNTLDCQWLDITDTPPGDYFLQVTLNPARAFQEQTFDNNTATVPVTLPAP
jgi:hypothetical protein